MPKNDAQQPLEVQHLQPAPDDAAASVVPGKPQRSTTALHIEDGLAQSIFDAIDASEHVMLVMHQKPDGDTAGSALGMSHYLDEIQKPHTVFCVDSIPTSLDFIPGTEKVVHAKYHWSPDVFQADLIMTFDGGDLARLGIEESVQHLREEGKAFTLINIDHHETNKTFGDINLVIRNGSSTCEIVQYLLQWKGALGKKASECLMTGLLTDTGHFMNLATTSTAVGAASALLQRGVNLKNLSTKTMRNRSLHTLKLWGIALERLQTTPHGIVYTAITQEDIDAVGADDDAVSGISNLLNALDQSGTTRAVLVLTQQSDGVVKGSFRTTHPAIDVSKMAVALGGGGHKKAAGFQLDGRLKKQKDGHWIIVPVAETVEEAV